MMPFNVSRIQREADDPFQVDRSMTYGQFQRDILPHITFPDIIKLSEGKPTIFRTFTTTLWNQSAVPEAEPLILPFVMDQSEGKYVDSMGRSRFFSTKIPQFSADTVSRLRDTLLKETLTMNTEPEILFGNTSQIKAYIRRSKLQKYRSRTMNLYSFKTFLKELDALHAKVQHDLSFLVVTPHQLLAYPTILPLFRNYGLQLLEPHYMLTAYLSQYRKPIYFFKRRKVYRYATQSYYMRTKFIERQFYAILNNQAKLSHGYVMSGLGYVFNHSCERGYQLLRNVLSNHHRPDYVIYIHVPEYLLEEIPRYLAFDPTTNYTILLYDIEPLKRYNIVENYLEGSVEEEDYVPKFSPFCFTTEYGNVNFCTILEWKTVRPKTIMLFLASNLETTWTDEGTPFFEYAGLVPDQIILLNDDEYNVTFDIGNYLFERLHVGFFTRTYPAKEFSVFRQPVTLEDILEWTNIEPSVPYYQCKYDRVPSITNKNFLKEKKEAGSEWLLNIAWTNHPLKRTTSYFDIHSEYYKKHIDDPIPSLQHICKRADANINIIFDKLNLKDIEGRIEYFQNLRKLPLNMRGPPDNKDWGRICPVTTLDEAMLFRGHYTYPVRFGTITYMLKSKFAVYKFLYNPMYRKLQWAWWTNSHILISGQPFCGAKYVATSVAMILKAPHIYYDPIYKTAVQIKRIHNHCYYLESCWLAIWFYKWNIYTGHEVNRFKRFLPWALRRVKIARSLALKGMDEASINRELRFRCYFPYYRLSCGQISSVFPRLEFEFPELAPKFISWEEEILDGYIRVLDLIILHVLNIECPSLFLARIIYQAPRHLLPALFEIEFPCEMFISTNVLYEYYYRLRELPRALEESRILCQAIFQAMAKRGTAPGEGWVVSGIKVYPNFLKRLSEVGVAHKVVYVTDPTFNVFQQVYVGDTRHQTAELARHFSYINRYVTPAELKKCHREMMCNIRQRIMTQKPIFPQEKGRSKYMRCSFVKREIEGPLKCVCHDLVLMHTRINACKNIEAPHAMTARGLADSNYSPIWKMLKNTATFPVGDQTCSYDHRNLNYHDHLPPKEIPVKRPRWKHIYCRRYAFDYFYKHSSRHIHPNVELEVRQIRPLKFAEMVTEIAVDNIKLPDNCCCRLVCLCNPISKEEYARFT